MRSIRPEEGRWPLPPDENGFCYYGRNHFNDVMRLAIDRTTEGRRSRLIALHTAPRLGLLLALVAGMYGLISFINATSLFWWILVVLGTPFLAELLGSERRAIRRILSNRLCLQCGYSLVGAEFDESESGRCPECSRTFNLKQFREPPRGYYRRPSGSWVDRLHPLDQARMRQSR